MGNQLGGDKKGNSTGTCWQAAAAMRTCRQFLAKNGKTIASFKRVFEK